MGLSKPDDEVDLKVFDTIRKIGAKAVSMGPMISWTGFKARAYS